MLKHLVHRLPSPFSRFTLSQVFYRMTSTYENSPIYIGADHGGYDLKNVIVKHLQSQGKSVVDLGVHSNERVDYPDYAQKVAEKVLVPPATPDIPRNVGIALCGTGIGISIAANKFPGIRAGLCHDHYTAVLTRRHNDANVLALGGRTTGPEVAKEIVDAFLSTPFDGGHHAQRLEKIHALEKNA